MSSVAFPRTIGHCSGTGTPICQPRFRVAHLFTERKHFLLGIKFAASIVYGALSRVTANAYLTRTSLPKAEASALLPVVNTSLSLCVCLIVLRTLFWV